MTAWLKLPAIAILLAVSGCVSAGTKAITDANVVAKIEVNKSTQADVAALLGYPLRATYGDQGEQTWHYTYITATPLPTGYLPALKAFTPDLRETTRAFAVTFDRQGVVKSLGPDAPAKTPSPSG
jgi:outer membrane protein assembly factor BamE (lipoprotein component of BamABCDE complex)